MRYHQAPAAVPLAFHRMRLQDRELHRTALSRGFSLPEPDAAPYGATAAPSTRAGGFLAASAEARGVVAKKIGTKPEVLLKAAAAESLDGSSGVGYGNGGLGSGALGGIGRPVYGAIRDSGDVGGARADETPLGMATGAVRYECLFARVCPFSRPLP